MKKVILYFLMAAAVPISFSAQAQSLIRSGDRFAIRVEGEPHLSARGIVTRDGNIIYRHLGEIKAQGLTAVQAGEKIKRLIRRHYPFLDNPQVTLLINPEIISSDESSAKQSDESFLDATPKETFVPSEADPVYRISVHDSLEISVFGEPELTRKVRVSEEGSIRYPLIGEVSVEGLTEEEVTRKVEELLRGSYFVDPRVSVFITEYAKFSVLGEVKRPGTFELKGPLTLVDAFVLAEGPLEHADLDHVKVFRSHGEKKGAEKEYAVNLEKEGKVFYLKPLDRIVVEPKGKIYILGAVTKPGIYHIKEKEITLSDALSFLAGGPAKNANISSIEVIRKDGSRNITYTVDLDEQGEDFLLQAQDRIVVKAYGSISVFGQVTSPGRYPYTKGLTAVDVLALAGGFTSVAARNGVRVIRKRDGEKLTIKVPVGYILATGDSSRDVKLKEEDTVVVPESWF